MSESNNNITLYTLQLDYVVDKLKQAGRVFCKREYISLKYGESAPILLAIYDWFAKEAARLVEKPALAETPYWAYTSQAAVELFPNESVLTLSVPRAEAIFFHIEDWSTVLRLQMLADNEAERRDFAKQLAYYGIKQESDILLTNFYPEQKNQVQNSWQRLFRDNAAIQGGVQPIHMQAALWQIKWEWVTDIRSVSDII